MRGSPVVGEAHIGPLGGTGDDERFYRGPANDLGMAAGTTTCGGAAGSGQLDYALSLSKRASGSTSAQWGSPCSGASPRDTAVTS